MPELPDRDTTGEPTMRRRTLLSSMTVAGLAGAISGGPRSPRTERPDPKVPRLALSSQQLAGQRIISSYPGLTPPSSLLSDIRSGLTAGVIFFGENISSTSQIASVVSQLRAAQAASPIALPLLLMTDQEGGEVRRLPGAPTQSEKTIGRSSNPTSAASSAGTGAGQNLRGVGMNVNLAPVLDVYYQAGNFIDKDQRSYSNNASTAAACGKAFITAQQATGVAATAKHFPGLGSATASQNTDAGPVTLTASASQLRAVDEVPYPSAVAAGVKLVMLSWAVYPSLDSSRLPAGLSSTIINQELRSRNGFTGVTITDALEAGALSAYGTTAQRAVAAAGAGMDLLLCSARDITQAEQATSALATAHDNGSLDPNTFTAAVNRINALRASLF
jgi:beta-N-acetylhexosaminidase